jgi:hypothetical protein
MTTLLQRSRPSTAIRSPGHPSHRSHAHLAISGAASAPSGLSAAEAAAAHLQSFTAAIYGLRKQLAVQRVRLNKEMRSLAAAAQQDDATDNDTADSHSADRGTGTQ